MSVYSNLPYLVDDVILQQKYTPTGPTLRKICIRERCYSY